MFRPSPKTTALFAGALCGALSLTPLSASAATDYRGGGYLTDFTGCTTTGWSGVAHVTARIRPDSLPGNSASFTHLTLFLNGGTISFRFEPDVGWFPVTATTVFSQAFEYTASARITSGSPTIFTGEPAFVYIEAEIAGFEGEETCNARAHLTFAHS